MNLVLKTVFVCLAFVACSIAFSTTSLKTPLALRRVQCRRGANSIRPLKTATQLSALPDMTSALIAVGDYAAEIEKAVGEEIYSPIFRAGIFLFLSGLISAFIAAFIISKAGSWDGLVEEFDAGKEAQLIKLDSATVPIAPAAASSGAVSAVSTGGGSISGTAVALAEEKKVDTSLDEIKGLDL